MHFLIIQAIYSTKLNDLSCPSYWPITQWELVAEASDTCKKIDKILQHCIIFCNRKEATTETITIEDKGGTKSNRYMYG